MTSWFPRPEHITDVQLLTPSAYPLNYFYTRLKDPQAQDWRDRVGVYGLREGSGKTTTRLLCHQDWVFKTDRSQATRDQEQLRQTHQQHQAQAQALGIYAPDKHWLLLREGEHWLPLTACPRLYTLRSRTEIASRLAGWVAMYRMGARLLRDQGIELDLNPANFASDPRGLTLWYLDDEWYTGQSDLSALGTSLAHRMAESEDLSLSDWYSLGTGVQQALRELDCSPQALRSLEDSLNEYPLRGAAQAARASFLRPLARRSVALRKETHRIGILADIHANLPALEAVLTAAADMGVNEYLILGDIVGYGPHPEACVARVSSLPLLAAIRGNHDQAVVSGEPELGMRTLAQTSLAWTQAQLSTTSKNWLATLPTTWPAGPIMAVHGSLTDPQHMYGYIYDMTYEANLKAAEDRNLAVLFFGHSHFPVIYRQHQGLIEQRLPPHTVRVQAPGCRLLINPGSVGQPRDRDPRAAFAIWDQGAQRVHFFRQTYPLAQTQADLRSAGLDERLAQRLEMGQ